MNTDLQIKKLGDICEFQNGFAFKSNLFKNKGFPVLRISNIQNDGLSYNRLVFFDKKSYKEDFDKYQVVKGDLVIAMSGATTGKLAISNEDEIFYLNQRVGKFIPGDDLSKDYLYYYLSTQIEENLKISSGAAQPNLSTEQIKNFKIPLPPLSNQKRIVKILDEVFNKVEKVKENAEKNLQNSKELYEAYTQSIFIDKENKWDRKKLNEICIVERGSSPRPIKNYVTDSADGVNWIKIGDTKNVNRYLYFINQKITKKGAEKSRFVKDGDLILSNSMSFGKPYIMKTTGYIHDGWFVLRPNSNLDTEYFYDAISSPQVQKQINALASGSVVKNISGDLVKKVILSIPSLKEQKSIVKKLDELSNQTKKLEEIYKKKLADLAELKKSVLKKAFTGML
jgi:type I restriction enzyme S subunit